jgi:hypothetical protein
VSPNAERRRGSNRTPRATLWIEDEFCSHVLVDQSGGSRVLAIEASNDWPVEYTPVLEAGLTIVPPLPAIAPQSTSGCLARGHRPCGWPELTSVTTLDACGLNALRGPLVVLYVLG